LGAYVRTLTLDGCQMTKPSGDGRQTHGGIAVLIPFADKVEKGRYTFEGKEFQLPLDKEGNGKHGFAKDALWKVKKREKHSVALTTLLNDTGYPGTLGAQITYSISNTTFSTDCSVTNQGKVNCPVVIGFHPYFLAMVWRLSAKSKVYRYLLRDRYFPTGAREPSSFDKLGPSEEVDQIFNVAGPVTLQTERYQMLIRRRAMPYLMIYNGYYAEGRSVSIEPYTGLGNAYNNGIGLRILGPGQSFRCGYDIILTARTPPH
jgi:aldose 1-epimerase